MAAYRLPEWRNNFQGNERRVGFELEFAGLEMPVVAEILADSLGGSINPETHAECQVEAEDLGSFKVELDWHFAKETAKQRAAQHAAEFEHDIPDDPFIEWLTKIASQVVPVEVVCPPIVISRLAVLDKMVVALRQAGALGTEESMVYAFGVHINPELPDLEPKTIVRYLQAFCVCQSWLVKAHEVDPVRRLTPYINLYPADYLMQVMSYTDVTMDALIDDYLQWNPTRNRALDLTPLFKFIDQERLESKLTDPRINSRPTFHYRMPNCAIENPTWTLSRAWNIWSVIEYLASHDEQLSELRIKFLDHQEKLISLEGEPWHPDLDRISKNLGSE